MKYSSRAGHALISQFILSKDIQDILSSLGWYTMYKQPIAYLENYITLFGRIFCICPSAMPDASSSFLTFWQVLPTIRASVWARKLARRIYQIKENNRPFVTGRSGCINLVLQTTLMLGWQHTSYTVYYTHSMKVYKLNIVQLVV